jgi:hypothetical protein
MAYCDGTVRYVMFDVDAQAHHLSGHVTDGGHSVGVP